MNPLAAYLGGVMAQEVIKAVSGKFTPLQQQHYFDASACLPDPALPFSEYKMDGDNLVLMCLWLNALGTCSN